MPHGAKPAGMFGSVKPPSVVAVVNKPPGVVGGPNTSIVPARKLAGEKKRSVDVDAECETFVDGAVCGIRDFRIVDGEDRVVSGGETRGPGGNRPVLGVEDESCL